MSWWKRGRSGRGRRAAASPSVRQARRTARFPLERLEPRMSASEGLIGLAGVGCALGLLDGLGLEDAPADDGPRAPETEQRAPGEVRQLRLILPLMPRAAAADRAPLAPARQVPSAGADESSPEVRGARLPDNLLGPLAAEHARGGGSVGALELAWRDLAGGSSAAALFAAEAPPPREHGVIRPLRLTEAPDGANVARSMLLEGDSGGSGGSGGNDPPEARDDPSGGSVEFGELLEVPNLETPNILDNDIDPNSDELSFHAVVSPPTHGKLGHLDESGGWIDGPAENGSYRYIPQDLGAGYVPGDMGWDQFSYKCTDGQATSNVATVSIQIKAPPVDIDTDSDNDGLLAEDAAEDAVEYSEGSGGGGGFPGNVLRYNDNDDDGNGVEDRLQGPGPLKMPDGQTPFDDPDLELVRMKVDEKLASAWVAGAAGGAEGYLQGTRLELTVSGPIRLWLTQDKEEMPASLTWTFDPYAPTDIPGEFYVEGYEPGVGEITWTVTDRVGQTVGEDIVRFTVVDVDMDAHTIYRNLSAGLLEDSQEKNPGAWVPRNSDDDDYDSANTADYLQTGAIAGENDLLPIVLHEIRPLGAGGTYQLEFNPGLVRLWQNADRSGAVVPVSEPNPTGFDATLETTLYVEGAAVGGAAPITINWHNASASLTDADRIVVNVFTWEGPFNVPGYSIYRYTATGGMAGSGNSLWLGPLHGSLNSSTQGDSLDEANILWAGGPAVGVALYQAQANYIWGLDVNVVQVQIGTPNAAATHGSPYQVGGAGSTLIRSSGATHAMTAEITVQTVEGPTVNGVQRGKKFMELGLSHQERMDAKHGLYNDTTPPKKRVSSLEDGDIHWDVDAAGNIPWIFLNAAHHLDITSDSIVVSNYPFSTFDRPTLRGTDLLTLDGHQVNELAIVMHHWVPLIVRTKDPRVIDPVDVLTERAILEWTFDGSGTVDPSGVWSLTGAGMTVPSSFTEIQDGRRLPSAEANFRESLAGEAWSTENQ